MAGKCHLVSVVWALLVLTIFHIPINVNAGEGVPMVALFTFGDSYYDAGNKVYLLTEKKNPPQTLWPYGKSRDDPNGKFSDGHIVPDFISDFMAIPDGIPPALKPGANLSRGASFAVADASILGAPAESVSLLTLKKQVWIYLEDIDFLGLFKLNPKDLKLL
ncbi:unnamed protein product [Thlaspi arvense]|uniref:Uncharacterized protein n=1 Tax=Thlaspi arvense TaxID=13288 RepID=A0AAU9S2V2_THLAR|nr:unnamed protein product [Thlaspi arvense]